MPTTPVSSVNSTWSRPYRVYEVSLDSRRAVLKGDDHPRGHAADEGRVQEYVARETAAGVPDVIAVGTDHYLTEWEPAFADSSEQVDEEWAGVASTWLGRLHAETAGSFEGFRRPRDGGSALAIDARGHWIDAARERVGYHQEYLRTVGHADVADAVDRFLRENPDVFAGCGEPVLCHGGVHPEYLARTGDGTATAIDFEHALVAPAEYDYWRAAMPYFEADDGVTDGALESFCEGYESVRELSDGFEDRRPAYRLLNLVAFLESLYLQVKEDSDEREAHGEILEGLVFETIEEFWEGD